jgi:hypothetical protein
MKTQMKSRKSNCRDPLRGRKVGDVMLLPIVLLTMTLSPVLLPGLITVFHVVANGRRMCIDDIVEQIVTRIVDRFGIESPTARRWNGVSGQKASSLKVVSA